MFDRCAAETQKKLADGDYHYTEVADRQRHGIVMFSRELKPHIQNRFTPATNQNVRKESRSTLYLFRTLT